MTMRTLCCRCYVLLRLLTLISGIGVPPPFDSPHRRALPSMAAAAVAGPIDVSSDAVRYASHDWELPEPLCHFAHFDDDSEPPKM